MFVSREIVINMDYNRLSILEEHHCIEAIFFVLKALRMEYSLDEITASVRNHTESWKQIAVAELTLSDIISSSPIDKNFDVLIFVSFALIIS